METGPDGAAGEKNEAREWMGADTVRWGKSGGSELGGIQVWGLCKLELLLNCQKDSAASAAQGCSQKCGLWEASA